MKNNITIGPLLPCAPYNSHDQWGQSFFNELKILNFFDKNLKDIF